MKGCPRCKQACTNQKTGIVDREPAKTLKTYRRMSKRNPEDFFFGQNVATTTSTGTIHVGDEVEILKADLGGEGIWDKDTIRAE